MADQQRPILQAAEPKGSRSRRDVHEDPFTKLWTGLFGLGVVLALVGWIDLGLVVWPPQFGNSRWEFGIITAIVDGLPVATTGTTLAALGALGRSWRGVSTALAVGAALVALTLVVLALLYLLDVPVALGATPPNMKSVLYRTLLKTCAFFATYILFYVWLAWFTWRRRPAE